MADAASRAREKISVTLERELMDEVRKTTDNVSAFVNDAVRDRLYFERLDREVARLDAEGVPDDPVALDWWLSRIRATKRRLAAERRAQKST